MSVESFITSIRAAVQQHGGGVSADIAGVNARGLAAFERLGIPTIRHEEWKYTNLMALMADEYAVSRSTTLNDEDIAAATMDIRATLPADHTFIVTVNGTVVALNSHTSGNGLGPLSTPSVDESHPFAALNAALLTGVVDITVPKNEQRTAPIYIAHIATAQNSNVVTAPRINVVAEQGASVTVIESFHTLGSNASLVVHAAELTAHAGSSIRHIKLMNDAHGRIISSVGGETFRDAVITTDVFCIGGDFVRNDLTIKLMEPNAQAFLNGISVLNNKDFADNHTVVDHLVPHCHSEELYKGVYDGASTGVFNGKIYVRPDAQKTTAYQSNHSILLSDRASVNAKPQLEIWADDVKCSHGATTGQLNEDAIYYLRARGIGHDDARAMMTYAFAAEVVERLSLDGLRTYIEHVVANKLGAAPFTTVDEEVIAALEEGIA